MRGLPIIGKSETNRSSLIWHFSKLIIFKFRGNIFQLNVALRISISN